MAAYFRPPVYASTKRADLASVALRAASDNTQNPLANLYPLASVVFRLPLRSRNSRDPIYYVLDAQPPINLLGSTLSVIPLVPFAQSDWPNPIALRTFLSLRTWLLSLQESTLPPPILATPFSMNEWKVPARAIYPIALRTFLYYYVLDASAPFVAAEWPLPRSRPHHIELRTFTSPNKLHLASKDQFFGAPGQPPANLDWPNPRAASRAQALGTWLLDLIQSTLATNPFSLSEWPTPRGALYPPDLRTFLQPIRIQAGTDAFYGARGEGPPNYDWPNPLIAHRPNDLITWTLNILQSTIAPAGPRPFSLTEWPLPLRPIFPSDLRTFVEALRVVAGTDQFPGATGPSTSQWPNPIYRLYPPTLRGLFDRGINLPTYGKDQMLGAPGQPVTPAPLPLPRASRWCSHIYTSETTNLLVFVKGGRTRTRRTAMWRGGSRTGGWKL